MNGNKNKKPDRTLALFDFDGTITKRDSFLDFLLFSVRFPRLLGGLFLLIPVIIAYSLKIITNEKAKQKVLSFFFKGLSKEKFYKIGDHYSANRIPVIIKDDAVQRIQWHKQQDHRVVIVSASLKSWLKGWCEKQGVDLICTQMEVENGYLTGRFNGKNCYGPEKVKRIKEQFAPERYYIYVYGDSRGDKEMLALANKRFYRFFRG
jgi:phosphatidylglycerophosphatase C